MLPSEYKQIVAERGKDQWLNRESDVEDFISHLKLEFKEILDLKILDAGCAQGRDTNLIADYGMCVDGLDYDKEFVVEAIKNYPKINFVVGKIESTPYSNNYFDAVYCVNTLFYTNPEESLKELNRILKINGILYITLDEKIFNIDENKEIHSLDINETLKLLQNYKILSKKYKERIDEIPFRHKHSFYSLVLKKEKSG